MTTLPNETVSATLGLGKRTGLRWLNITLLILLALTMLSLPGGADAIHYVGGIFLLIGCGVHLVLHGRWIKAVILDTPKNVTPTLRRQRRLFWGMFLSGLFCGLSGLATLPVHVHAPHTFLPMLCCGAPIHILSGLAFFGLTINHLVLHRNWFGKICRGDIRPYWTSQGVTPRL
jgi:hypothetical protein